MFQNLSRIVPFIQMKRCRCRYSRFLGSNSTWLLLWYPNDCRIFWYDLQRSKMLRGSKNASLSNEWRAQGNASEVVGRAPSTIVIILPSTEITFPVHEWSRLSRDPFEMRVPGVHDSVHLSEGIKLIQLSEKSYWRRFRRLYTCLWIHTSSTVLDIVSVRRKIEQSR